MTGNWEMRLNDIALSKENPAQFIADISHTTGRTEVIKGFKSKVDKPFSAVLYIDRKDRTVKFNFQKNT